MQDPDAPIVLAHAPDFTIGSLGIRPSTREVTTASGAHEVLEPRVMQVLVALDRAQGAVVSRDDLSRSCWDSRVVGDDAINRVISRLRRLAESSHAFRVETVTKVGFRLVRTETGDPMPDAPDAAAPAMMHPSRRWVLTGAAAVGLVGATAWLFTRRPKVPPEVVAMTLQAELALGQDSAEGNAQSIGLYRRIVEIAPEFADGWAGLGVAYAVAAHQNPTSIAAQMRARVADAAERALAIEPRNLLAKAAMALSSPYIGAWQRRERALRPAIAAYPRNSVLGIALGSTLYDLGKPSEAADILSRSITPETQTPLAHYLRTSALWSSARLEDADRAAREMIELYPRHIGVWFTYVIRLYYSGRAEQALAMLADRAARPPGVVPGDFDIVEQTARALLSGATSDIERALIMHQAAGRRGAGYANNAMQFASATGHLDAAFELANALFFDRGFAPQSVMFTEPQAAYLEPKDRLTRVLFMPTMANARRDARFAGLVHELGLDACWKAMGIPPDYQNRPA